MLLAGCLLCLSAPSRAAAADAQEGAVPGAAAEAGLEPAYYIAPGDILKIAVWKEPELTTDAFVRLDGRVTVPLLGDVMAAGRTPNDLAADIQAQLRRFVEVPRVTLAVSQTVSARFYVLGEVANPGAYPLPSRISVIQALALAGGFREFAKKEKVLIVRERGPEKVAIPFNYSEVQAGVRLEQDIFLESGDTVLVP